MALQLENTAFTSLFYVYLNSIINFHVSVKCLATLKVNPKPMYKREIMLLFIHVFTANIWTGYTNSDIFYF